MAVRYWGFFCANQPGKVGKTFIKLDADNDFWEVFTCNEIPLKDLQQKPGDLKISRIFDHTRSG